MQSDVVFHWNVELFSQSGIVLLECGTVLTIWYCFIGVWNCFYSLVLVFFLVWNCSYSLVLFYWSVELFSQSGIVF